jgi:hypothetical protein
MPSITETERALALELEAEEAALEKAAQEPEIARADHGGDEYEQRIDPKPILDTSEPENATERLAALSEQKAALVQKFDDGEITAREYSDALETLSDRREDIKFAQRKARMASEQVEYVKDSAWWSAVDKFMAGPGRDIAKNDARKIAFDEYVKKVTGDAANARLSDKAQLELAHRMFKADFGGGFGGDSSSAHGSGGSDFATLDRLAESNPREFERRVAKMTPAEREAYGID